MGDATHIFLTCHAHLTQPPCACSSRAIVPQQHLVCAMRLFAPSLSVHNLPPSHPPPTPTPRPMPMPLLLLPPPLPGCGLGG